MHRRAGGGSAPQQTASCGRAYADVAQIADMESLEPDSLNSMSSVDIANLLWVRLMNLRADGRIVPMPAESYAWNDTGTMLATHLREPTFAYVAAIRATVKQQAFP